MMKAIRVNSLLILLILISLSTARSSASPPVCSTFTLPFTETFSGSGLPACWTVQDHIGNGDVWQFGTITSYSAPPLLTDTYAYLDSDAYGNGSVQNSDLITPPIDCTTASAVLLTFNHRFVAFSGSSGTVSFSVDGGNTWTEISTINYSTANPQGFSQLIPQAGGHSDVRVRWNYTGSWGYHWAIDDIHISSSCIQPSAQAYYLQATGVTTTSMNLSWKRGNGNGTLIAVRTAPITAVPSDGNSYSANTSYGSGADLGGGTYVVYSGPDSSCTITNLPVNSWCYISLFEYNAPSYCYNTTTSSYMSNTLCSTISTFPYQENFEYYGYSPICWEQQYIQGTLLWQWDATSGGGGIPSSAHSGTYCVRLYDGTAGTANIQKLRSPRFDLTNRVNNTISFWHTQAASTLGQDQLKVYYKMSYTSPWVLLATYSDNITSWTKHTLDLPNPSADYYLAFEGIENGGQGICIDDLELNGTPLTLNVTPLTQTVSAVTETASFGVQTPVNWTAVSDASWCTVSSSGPANSNLQAVFGSNNSTQSRTAHITVTVPGLNPVTVTLIQSGKVPYITVSPSSQTAGVEAGTVSFTVNSNMEWTSVSDQPWCFATYSGNGNGIINANFSANNLTVTRAANITVFSSGLLPVMVTVVQDAAATPGYRFTIANEEQTSDRTLEFDLLLLNTDPSDPFELASVQAGILLNSTILNGGTLSASILPGTSTLNPAQQPSSITFTQSAGVIKLAAKAPPGAGNGSILSADPLNPTRICRIKLTNSTVFGYSTPNLTFNFTTQPYPTKISRYVSGVNTAQLTGLENCFSTCANSYLGKSLQITAFLEGFCTAPSTMHPALDNNGPKWNSSTADVISIELHSPSDYNNLIFSIDNLPLSLNGNCRAVIPGNLGGNYYITLRHRNSIETCSAQPVSFAGQSISCPMNSPADVYGNNLKLDPWGNWVIFGGDIIRDGVMDSSDMIINENAATVFSTGYLSTDVNGDGIVDSWDMILIENNVSLFTSAITP